MQSEQSEEILVIMEEETHIFMKSNLSVNKYLQVPTIFLGLKTIIKDLYQNSKNISQLECHVLNPNYKAWSLSQMQITKCLIYLFNFKVCTSPLLIPGTSLTDFQFCWA